MAVKRKSLKLEITCLKYAIPDFKITRSFVIDESGNYFLNESQMYQFCMYIEGIVRTYQGGFSRINMEYDCTFYCPSLDRFMEVHPSDTYGYVGILRTSK